ncbi:MAG: sulfotransferase family protein [Bryobacteraceae bacterium]
MEIPFEMNRAEPQTRGELVRAPVFIVGAKRSGTTLLQLTLNRHPQLAMCGETAFLTRVYARRRVFGDPADPRNRERIVSEYLPVEPLRGLGTDAGVLRERLRSEGVSWGTFFAALIQVYADAQGKPYCGEKTPGHALYATTLCQWFPNCAIIHLVRDPRAAVCSLARPPWATHSVLLGARRWRALNTAACAVSGRDNYLLVKYEELVTRPEEQLRRICNHIGLEYHAALLRADPAEADYKRPDFRAYERITPERLALWRTELEPWQVSAIEAVAGPHMQQFGYQRQTGAATASLAPATLDALVETTLLKFLRLPSLFYRIFQPANLAVYERLANRAAATYERLRPRPPAANRPPRDASGRV